MWSERWLSTLNHCLEWDKFVLRTHSLQQWFNIGPTRVSPNELLSWRLSKMQRTLLRLSQKVISRLQRVQHALARVVMQQAYRSSSSTELLKQLHWLPIEWRIRFKLATSTYKALHTGHPPYLTDLLQYHKSSVSTRSSTSQLLAIPRHNLSFGSRSFRVSAPRIWNSLSPQIRQCQTLATFRCHLKTHYFQSAFSAT